MRIKVYVSETDELVGKICSISKSELFPIGLALDSSKYCIKPYKENDKEKYYIIEESKLYKRSKITLYILLAMAAISLIFALMGI